MKTNKTQLVLWNLGWLVLVAAWISPLVDAARQSFAAHMLVHMLVVAVAAPLLSISVARSVRNPVLSWPRSFSAIAASLGEALVVWFWHMPKPHRWTQESDIAFIFEQSTFLLVGMWLWLSAFACDHPQHRQRSAAGALGLLLTSMHMTLLGALLALSPRPLFVHSEASSHTDVFQDKSRNAWIQTTLDEQHLGGAMMLVIGGASYLTGGVYLVSNLARDQAPAHLVVNAPQ